MVIIVNVSKTVARDTTVNHPSIQPHAASEWKLDRGSGKGLLKAKDNKYAYVVAVRDGKPIGYYKKVDANENSTTKRVIFNLITVPYPSKETNKIDNYLRGDNLKGFVYKFV